MIATEGNEPKIITETEEKETQTEVISTSDTGSTCQAEITISPTEIDLSSHLKCPDCSTYIRPPIYTCQNGHNFCNKCLRKSWAFLNLREDNKFYCSLCHISISYCINKCIIIDHLVKRVKYPCEYKYLGCCKNLDIDSLSKHEESCNFKLYKCPFYLHKEKCFWKGTSCDLRTHIVTNHTVTTSNESLFIKYLRPLTDRRLSKMRVLIANGNVYIWVCKKIRTKLFTCIQYVGPDRHTKTHNYKITLTKLDKSISFSFDCDYYKDKNWETSDCAILDLVLIKQFINKENMLEFKIEVNTTENHSSELPLWETLETETKVVQSGYHIK
ncbi:hypothetical protein C0J52_22150 [Blattella germanica]|nr:hypothetical protein C0J52_22150 [Blattella germanica]